MAMVYVIVHDAVIVMPGTQGGEVVAYMSPRQFCAWAGRVGVEVWGGRVEVWEEEDECAGTR
jgi:hypothetical protein